MSSLRRRRYVLAVLLALIGLLAAFILFEVVEIVFFAVTVAYVLYPLRQRLTDRGIPRRIASAIVTLGAFVAVVLLLAPIAWAIVSRRGVFIELLQDLPPELSIELFGFVYLIQTDEIVQAANDVLTGLAISLATASLVIALQLALFVILLYGLLLRPSAVGRATFEITPPEYHDIIRALHTRVAGTLYALYVIQAATAVLTFPIALLVFYALGYDSVFVLAVVASILQFVPIVGPGMLSVALAGYDIVIEMPERALGIIILGPLLIGLLPDVLVRPKLATRPARLPASLYFVGFVGGVLTVGVVGIIAGPLVVALLVEVVALLSDGRAESNPS